MKRRLIWLAAGIFLIHQCGCSPAGNKVTPKPSSKPIKFVGRKTPFKIFWPPAMKARSPEHMPILTGNLCVTEPDERIQFHFEVSRPSAEGDRKRWNRVLAFPEYSWMSKVRVWDKEKKWLWPNLHCLLTAHGRKRAERYGGIDPGKGVDNDYAAVLVRKLDDNGQSVEADKEPLVSAEWFPVDPEQTGKIESISHDVLSDRFSIELTKKGSVGIWLIYADFLDSKPPREWPKEKEFAGGILAFFEVNWEPNKDGKVELTVEQAIPKNSTGFDWRKWSTHSVPFQKKLK